MKHLLRWGLTLLGPAILIYFLLTSDLAAVGRVITSTDPWMFFWSSVLVLPFLLVKGWRWRLILQGWNIRISTWFAAQLYTLGIFVGSVTPGQGGDAIKAGYLRHAGYPLGPSLLSIVVDRFFDVAIMGLIAASGLFFFRDALPGNVQVLIVLVLAGVVAGSIVLASARLRLWVTTRMLPVIIPSKLRQLASRAGLRDRALDMGLGRIGTLVLVSFVTLGFTFLRLFLLFVGAGVWMDLGPYMAMIAIVSLVSVVSVAGIGIRDAVMVVLMTRMAASGQMRPLGGGSFTPEQAQALAIGISTLFLILNIVNVVLGYLVSLRYPLTEAFTASKTDGDDWHSETA